jgi:hypothetical protein
MNDLLGGKVQVLFGTTAVAIEHIRAGKVAEGLEVGWVRRVSDPSPRWTCGPCFAARRRRGTGACLYVRPSGPVALQRLRFCRRPVTPLFLRCFFSAARNTDRI